MSNKNKLFISLGLLTLFLQVILQNAPAFVERFYSRGLFLGIRWLFDHTLALSPIPIWHLFYVFIFMWLLYQILKPRFKRLGIPLWKKILNPFFSLLSFAGIAVFLFMFLWGFNYSRIPFEKSVGLQIEEMSTDDLYLEAQRVCNKVAELRAAIPNIDTFALDKQQEPKNLERLLRQELETELKGLQYPTVGNVRARQIGPRGILLRNSTSGIYVPYFGEGHVDKGLHPLSKTPVMSHEMSHGYGFGDEAVCNFLAWLAGSRSSDPFVRYAGELAYWRNVMSDLKRLDYDRYKSLRNELDRGVSNDLAAIYTNNDKYPDLFPKAHDKAYDKYLKIQGVKEGIKSYNRVVVLVMAWNRKQGN